MAATKKDARSALVVAVAKKLRELRRSRGMTTEAMADALGIAVQNYRRIESGQQNLTLKTIEKIAAVLSVTVTVLFKDA